MSGEPKAFSSFHDAHTISGMISSRKAALELIAFYVESGADAAIRETPVDRMAEAPALAGPRPDVPAARSGEKPDAHSGQAKAAPRAAPPASPEAAIMAAREAAKNAKSLDELRSLLVAFEGCALRATATQLVFADGTPQSRVMF